jgi:hypothetical protein
MSDVQGSSEEHHASVESRTIARERILRVSESTRTRPTESRTENKAAEILRCPEDMLQPSSVTAESDIDEAPEQPQSELAGKLDRLKAATLKVIQARERLPQPLFWSLFHTELESIKRKRRALRAVRAAQYDSDWL